MVEMCRKPKSTQIGKQNPPGSQRNRNKRRPLTSAASGEDRSPQEPSPSTRHIRVRKLALTEGAHWRIKVTYGAQNRNTERQSV